MKLSVIIPCYNAVNTVGVQLKALSAQEWSESWEVIFADNGSSDGSIDIVKSYLKRIPNLRIIDASARRGQPYALNTGAKAAKGESLAFCDADDEVGKGWVAAMGNALSMYDFVAGRMDAEKLNSSWLRLSRGNAQGEGLQLVGYPPYLPHAGGGTLGVKKAIYESVGDFDETLPILHDTDFCFRVQLSGIKLHFVPDAVIHVRFRSSMLGLFHQSRNYAEYNVLLSKRYKTSRRKIVNSWIDHFRGWAKVGLLTVTIWSRPKRFRWARSLGRQFGALRGSFKHYTPPV